MKRLAIVLLMVSLIFPLFAQPKNDGATAVVNEMAKKYAAFSSMKINYTLKIEKDKKTLSTSTGVVQMAGDKYVADFAGQKIFCDGKTVWNYQPDVKEVSVFDYDPTDDNNLMNPAKMLKNWSKAYSAKLIREEMQKNKMVQIIDLKPLKMGDVYKIRLFVDKSKKELVALAVYETDNTVSSYYVDKFVANAVMPASQFVFDTTRYPGVEINDMR